MKKRVLSKSLWVASSSLLVWGCGGSDGASSSAGGGGGGTSTSGSGAVTTSTTSTTSSTSSTGGAGGAPLAALGTPCSDGTTCASGSCSDGVCCDSACGSTCESCVAVDTGKADGTCAPVTVDTDPASECSDAEACATGLCDGAGACAVKPAATVCRAAGGSCDVAEACDGVSPTCPTDAVATSQIECRAAQSTCDVAELCDGTSVDCPTDAVSPATVSCGGFFCSGTSGLCPTSCADDRGCVANDVCISGACVPGRRVFITSTVSTGAIGGLAGGDALCQGLANAANLHGAFKIWLSDATNSPSTRFDQSSVPYYRMDGTMVASSYADLVDGTIMAPIHHNELGGVVAPNIPFTSTQASGLPYSPGASPSQDNCSGWTSQSATDHGHSGYSEGTTTSWSLNLQQADVRQCNVLHRYFCFGN